MYVVKRDGRKEVVHFDKITARIKKLAYGLSEHCDPVRGPSEQYRALSGSLAQPANGLCALWRPSFAFTESLWGATGVWRAASRTLTRNSPTCRSWCRRR